MFNTKQPLCCDKSSPFISKSSCVFHKTLHFKNPHVFSQNTSFYINHLNPSNYKTCLYNLFVYLYTKNTKDRPLFFSQKHYISKKSSCVLTKHLNPSNYKPCLYNLFVYLHTKIPKTLLCFFHKNTTFQKNPHVFFHKTLFSQKHYISYQKHLNLSIYKTCLYNLFVYLYTKNTKDHPVFFTKHFFHKQPVINPSKYKICFISEKIFLCFSQNTFFKNNLS